MKTKKVLWNRMAAIGMDNRVYFTFPKHTYILQKFPYRREHYKNSIFHFACQFLEPETNMLAFFGKNNIAMPATINVLAKICGRTEEVFRQTFQVLVNDGIVMRVSSAGVFRYYMNPNFAIAGDNLPIFLYEMFNVSNTEMLGEHLFSKDNEIRNDNRNKDNRFGNLKNIRTRDAVVPVTDGRLKQNKGREK